MFTSIEIVFNFFFTSVPILVKIHQEMRAGECARTDTRTEATGFIICPMLYAIAMGQICLLACPIDNTRRFCRETDAVTQRQANDEEEDRHAKVITEPVFQRNVYV